jgi:hypothetical protein
MSFEDDAIGDDQVRRNKGEASPGGTLTQQRRGLLGEKVMGTTTSMLSCRVPGRIKHQAENNFPVSNGFGCHEVRYSEPVCLNRGLWHGFGVPNLVAPSAWSTTREVILSLFLSDGMTGE